MNSLSRAIMTSRFAIAFLCVLLGANTSPHAYGQDAVLVKDINTYGRALQPQQKCHTGTNTFFVFDDGIRGSELWVGDGLAGTTRLVKDIYPGSDSSISGFRCFSLNGILYFGANEGTNGTELWRSDGTTEGTYLVRDIRSGSSGSDPFYFVALGSKILFSATTDAEGTELWQSDGTSEGTTLLSDIYVGASGSSPQSLTLFSDTKIIFSATTAANGREIYESDGTPGGTVLLADIYAGATSSSPNYFTKVGNLMLFEAGTAAAGRELWSTDGTTGGTVLVKDVRAGATNGTDLTRAAVINDKLFFLGFTAAEGFEPWISDGTTGGTTLLLDIRTGAQSSFPGDTIVFKNRVFFGAMTAASGTELWSTDGTPSGTVQQSEIGAGADSGVSRYYNFLVSSDGNTLFLEGSTLSGSTNQIYSTDGTPLSFTKVLDIGPGSSDLQLDLPAFPLDVGVPVAAPEPVDTLPPTTTFLSDGTLSGTTIHPGTLVGYNSSSTPIILGTVGGKVLFAADDGDHGYELWTTDGTASGTSLVKDSNQGFGWSILPSLGAAVLNDKLLFVGLSETEGAELWISDGTSSGTSLLKDIRSGIGSAFHASGSIGHIFYALPSLSGGRVIFPATTDAEGTELWITDGTTGGTTLLKDIYAGSNSGVTDESLNAVVTTNGAALIFTATDGANGREPWGTNGTSGGTSMLADIIAGAGSSNPDTFVAIPSLATGVVFVATGASGRELYLYNGATSLIKDIYSGGTGSNPADPVFVTSPGVKVIFSADDGAHGRELWISDGTNGGTSLLKDILTGVDGSSPSYMTAIDASNIVFQACSQASSSDCELWKSDGTTGGTVLVKDLATGTATASTYPSGFQKLGTGTDIYFVGIDGTANFIPRLFRTDLTEGGTVRITQPEGVYFGLESLPRFFYPYQAAGSDPTLLFPFGDSAQGFELYKIGADECPTDDTKTSAGLCGCNVSDGDSDLDGAVDCLEACPSDPKKIAAGTCGCGVADSDSNANGIADCIDAEVASITPPRPRLKKRKKVVKVRLTARTGIEYVVQTRTYPRSLSKKRIQKRKWTTKTYTTETFNLRRLKSGKVLEVRYKYQVLGDDTIASSLSKKSKLR